MKIQRNYSPDPRHLSSFLAVILFSIIGLIVYGYSFQAGFQYDDYKVIVENPAVQHLPGIKYLWDFDPSRFLVHLSFAVNFAISRLEVFSYHAVNLFLHVACACSVFFFVKIILGSPQQKISFKEKHRDSVAFLTALLFLVHPLQTQAVTYIVQRSTVMVSLFCLLSLIGYEIFRQRQDKRYCALSLALAFLGALSKPVIIVLPFLIILCELFFPVKPLTNIKKRLIGILPYFVVIFLVGVFLALWRYHGVSWQGLWNITRETPLISRGTYFLTQLNVIAWYLILLFLPFRQNLDYDFPLSHSLFGFPTVFSFFILLGIFISIFRIRKKHPLLAFGAAWFFITLVPESSIFPLSDVIFEHRLYLPMVGFSFFLSVSLFTFIENQKRRMIYVLLIILFLSGLTIRRNYIWADSERLLSDTIAKSPQKVRPVNNLGDFYLRKGQLSLAEEYLKKAIALAPSDPQYYCNLGWILENQNRLDEAQDLYEKGVKIGVQEVWPKCYFYLANLCHKRNNLTKAELFYQGALIANPDFADAYNNLANLYAQQEKYEDALVLYRKALEANPYLWNAYNGIASVYSMRKEYDKAIEEYRRLIRMQPQLSLAYNNLGNTYVLKKDLVEAEKILKQAIKINSRDASAYQNLANVYYGLGRRKDAQANIRIAVSLLKQDGKASLAAQLQERFLQEEK